jgi:hypothetical protein
MTIRVPGATRRIARAALIPSSSAIRTSRITTSRPQVGAHRDGRRPFGRDAHQLAGSNRLEQGLHGEGELRLVFDQQHAELPLRRT